MNKTLKKVLSSILPLLLVSFSVSIVRAPPIAQEGELSAPNLKDVEFSEFEIWPKYILPDANVTISFDIRNNGNQSGTCIFQIWIQAPQSKLMQQWNPSYREGPLMMQRYISIEAGRDVGFSISIKGHFIGTHQVTVKHFDRDVLQGSFEVVEPSNREIGVEVGDTWSYDSYYYQSYTNFTGTDYTNREVRNETHEYNANYILKVVQVDGGNITIHFTNDRGNTKSEKTVKADMNAIFSVDPGYEIYSFLIPANLSPGDFVLFGGETFRPRINETVVREVLGEERLLNHIKYTIIRGEENNWKQWIIRDSYYDKYTGIMVEGSFNSTKVYFNVETINGTSYNRVYVGKQNFKINSSNVWNYDKWYTNIFYYSAASALFIITVIIIFKRSTIKQFINRTK